MSDILKYNSDKIKNIQNQYKFKKANMTGYYERLNDLKGEVDNFYERNIFYLDYELSEASYHGWDGEHLEDMKKHAKEIEIKFLELYALVLMGIGE